MTLDKVITADGPADNATLICDKLDAAIDNLDACLALARHENLAGIPMELRHARATLVRMARSTKAMLGKL